MSLFRDSWEVWRRKVNETIGGGGDPIDSKNVTYDGTSSGLSATNVQGAIDEVAKGGRYVYALKNYFKHIAITASKSTGQYVKLITTNDEINALTSSSAFNANIMNQQKVIRNNSNASSTWTYSINGLTLNLNCTSDAIGCIISNFPLTFTTVATSTPEANTLEILNLALLSNS